MTSITDSVPTVDVVDGSGAMTTASPSTANTLSGSTRPALASGLERAAAGTLERVIRPAGTDWSADPGTARLRAPPEPKTVRHLRGW